MSHFKSNVRDIEFNLFEVFGTDTDARRPSAVHRRRRRDRPGHDPPRSRSSRRVRSAASFADADRNPPVFDPDTYSVTMPESFAKSFKALARQRVVALARRMPAAGRSARPAHRRLGHR